MWKPLVCPDIFDDEPWAVRPSQGLQGATLKGKRAMYVPLGDTPSHRAIKRHEMGHVAVGLEDTYRMDAADKAAEDLLVNHWVINTAELSLPLRPEDAPVPQRSEYWLPYLCAVDGTPAEEVAYRKLHGHEYVANIREAVNAAKQEIGKHLTNQRTLTAMARHLRPLVLQQDKEMSLPQFVKQNLTTHDWARMEEVRLPLTKRAPKLSGRKSVRPYRSGEVILFPERLTSDSKVFPTKDRGGQGSLLVDCSGSMSWSMDNLQKVIDMSPRFVTACYWGCNHTQDLGKLAIVSARGKYHPNPPEQDGHGNKVDGPALRWLGRQPAPRFWLSDGGITGIGDQGADEGMRKEVAGLLVEHRITQVYDFRQFVAEMKRRKFA